MTSTFADLLPGDEIWVLNSHFNSAFEADVISAQDGEIKVSVPHKRTVYTFDAETGHAKLGGSRLAFDDDWRVKAILYRKEHLRLHQEVINAASALQKDPGNLACVQRFQRTSEEWLAFIANADDTVAMTSASLHIYLQKTRGADHATREAELYR